MAATHCIREEKEEELEGVGEKGGEGECRKSSLYYQQDHLEQRFPILSSGTHRQSMLLLPSSSLPKVLSV